MGHVTYFWNFETTTISRNRVKLETSNLARILTIRSISEDVFFGPPSRLHGWASYTVLQIQNGSTSCKISTNANNFSVIRHTLTELGGIKKGSMP